MVTAAAVGVRSGGKVTQTLGRLAIAGVIAYVCIDVLLALLRPDYSLLYNAESDYGRGPWSWLMDVNFLLRCALSLAAMGALAETLRPLRTRAGAGLMLLGGWAVCSGLLAFFPDDLEGQPVHGSGAVHLVLAFFAFCCVAAASLLVTSAIWREPGWHRARPVLLALAIAGAVALLVLFSAARHASAPGGLYERLFLGLQLLWIVVAAGWAVTAAAPAG